MGLPVVTGPPDGVGLHRVVGLPGAVGCQLSLDILFIVIRLLSLSPAPTWPACLSWVNPGKSQAAARLVTSLALALALLTLWCFNISAKIIT